MMWAWFEWVWPVEKGVRDEWTRGDSKRDRVWLASHEQDLQKMEELGEQVLCREVSHITEGLLTEVLLLHTYCYTVEPPNKGHFALNTSVPCREDDQIL